MGGTYANNVVYVIVSGSFIKAKTPRSYTPQFPADSSPYGPHILSSSSILHAQSMHIVEAREPQSSYYNWTLDRHTPAPLDTGSPKYGVTSLTSTLQRGGFGNMYVSQERVPRTC